MFNDGASRVTAEPIFSLSHHRVKDQEKESVFQIIQEHGPVSQKQILTSYRIRPTALSKAIKELVSDGLIEQKSNDENRGLGRPEIFFRLRNRRLVCLAIYTDSWVFRAVALDLAGAVVSEHQKSLSPYQDTNELLRVQCELINALRADLSSDTIILGVGLSLPGNVDTDKPIWRESRRWPNIRTLDYRRLEDEYGFKFALSRDLDAALLNELMHNPNLMDELAILLHWGIGLGISFAYRGTIIRSNQGRFGTIGYTQFDPHHKDHVEAPDLERFTSLRSLITPIRRKHPDLPLDERRVAALLGDDDLRDVPEVQTAIEYVGLALRNTSAIFYPDRVYLLSPFSENGGILTRVREAFASGHLIDELEDSIPIEPVKQGYRGCMFGATHSLFAEGLRSYLKARY